MSEISRKMYGILALVIIIAGASLTALVLFQPTGEGDTELFIEVVGVDASKNITLTDMLAEPAILRNGSFQNSYGNIRGAGEYRGITVATLLDEVGGMDVNDTVTVESLDGYSQTFSYSKVYPNQTIFDIQGDMVIAYQYNGSIVPDYEDGFRLVFLPEDGYYSNIDANASSDPDPIAAGPQCVSNVVRITINPYTPLFSLTFEDSTLYYSLSELMAMSSVTGEGGYVRSTGTIFGPHTFKGVPFTALLNEFAPLPSNYSVIVKASDDYTSEYTKTIIEGTVNGYNATGDPIGEINCTMILAYEMDSAPISSDDGPLRVAFLNTDGNLTDGFNWARNVANITMVEESLSIAILQIQEDAKLESIELWITPTNNMQKK